MPNENFSLNNSLKQGSVKEQSNQKPKKNPLFYFFLFLLLVFVFIGGLVLWRGRDIFFPKKQSLTSWPSSKQDTKPQPELSSDYYALLAKECQKCSPYSVKDCLKSVEIMRENNYKEPDKQGNCPAGFRKNTLKCICCFSWCEPGE